MTTQIFISLFIGLGIGVLAGYFWGNLASALRHRKEAEALTSELASLRTKVTMAQEQESKIEDMESALADRFELLANRIFEEKNKNWSSEHSKNLSLILDPLKERIKDFEKKVEETYSTERSERGSLRGELSRLIELNQKMTIEAENLTKALKGDNKASGNWGEWLLESALERSGLRKGDEYEVQETHINEDGTKIRPDVVLYLPDGKNLIIDSKVSLVAYDRYIQADTDSAKEIEAKAHLLSLQRHIDDLSAKKYHTSKGLISPDFVILFMPIEPAFALAFKLKPDLLSYAWDHNIALVSPTTLLTTLKTVSALWRQDRQEKNALEIAQRGGQLYDKFVLLYDSLTDLSSQFEKTSKSFATVMNRLKDGSGNLISQVEKLRELGAKASKQLPAPDSKES